VLWSGFRLLALAAAVAGWALAAVAGSSVFKGSGLGCPHVARRPRLLLVFPEAVD
jgi:hypothetical protein